MFTRSCADHDRLESRNERSLGLVELARLDEPLGEVAQRHALPPVEADLLAHTPRFRTSAARPRRGSPARARRCRERSAPPPRRADGRFDGRARAPPHPDGPRAPCRPAGAPPPQCGSGGATRTHRLPPRGRDPWHARNRVRPGRFDPTCRTSRRERGRRGRASRGRCGHPHAPGTPRPSGARPRDHPRRSRARAGR